MKTTVALDHGVLNIPGRTNAINAELDAYKLQQVKQQRVKAAECRARRAQAKQLFNELWPAMKEKWGSRFGEKELHKTLDSMAKWESSRFIAVATKFLQEQQAEVQR